MDPLAVSEKQAAHLLSVPRREVRWLLARGEIEGRMIGNYVIVSIESLRRFVNPQKEKADPNVARSDRRKPEDTDGVGQREYLHGEP
jgi:hypothetical protein